MRKLTWLAALALLAQPAAALSPTKAWIARQAQVCQMFQAFGFRCDFTPIRKH